MPTGPQDRKPAAKKTASRRTVQRAVANPEEKYNPTSWGSSPGGVLEDLTVPSGQLALVRRPGVEGLIKAGVLHNIDSLTSLVDDTLAGKGAEDVTEKDVIVLLEDPEKYAELMQTLDRILCYVVVKPEIQMTPGDVTRREPGVIYADMVDIMDKMFLLNYTVGGTRDLERFRQEHDSSMGSVAAVAKNASPTKRAVRNPR